MNRVLKGSKELRYQETMGHIRFVSNGYIYINIYHLPRMLPRRKYILKYEVICTMTNIRILSGLHMHDLIDYWPRRRYRQFLNF